MVIPGHNLVNSQVSVNRTIGPTLVLFAVYLIHFKFVGIKDMHNIYYLELSGEHRCPLGYLLIDYSIVYGIPKFRNFMVLLILHH